MLSAPARLLIVRAGTVADWIRTEPLLRLARAQFPEAVVAVTLTEGQADLLRLLGSGLRALAPRFDPREGPQAAELTRLLEFRQELAAFAPDWVIAPATLPTWFEEWVALECAGARRVGMGAAGRGAPFDELVPVPEGAGEPEQLAALAQAVFGAELPGPPALDLTVTRAEAERDLRDLAALGLEPGRFAACGPGGTGPEWQAWPVAHYAEMVAQGEAGGAGPMLLCGRELDRGRVEAVRDAAVARGAKPRVWLAADGDFPRLVNLVAQGRCFVGHDSDLLHAAAAAGVPALGIFGGGTWPGRSLWGAAAIASVVQPLACFGCGWNCRFGNAPCLHSLPVGSVTAALRWLQIARPGDVQIFEVPAGQGLGAEVGQFIARQVVAAPAAVPASARLASAEAAVARAALAREALDARLAALEQERERASEEAARELAASEQARVEGLGTIQRLRAEAGAHAARLAGLESELAIRRTAAIALGAELREAVRQRDAAGAAQVAWEQRDAERTRALQALQEAGAAAETERTALRERLEQQGAELNDWRRQAGERAAELIELGALQAAAERGRQEQIALGEREREAWKMQTEARAEDLAAAQARLAAAEAEVGRLQASLNERGGALGTIMARAAVAEGSLEALRAQHAASEADRASLREQVAQQAEAAVSHARQVAVLQQQLEAMGRTLAEKEAQLALPPPVILPPEAVEVEAMRERAARAEGEMQTLRLQQAVIEGASATRILTIERQAAELEVARAARAESEARRRALQEAAEAAGAELARVTTAHEAALQAEAASRARAEGLAAELAPLRARLDAIESERVSHLEVIGQQGEKLAAAQSTLEEFERRLAHLDDSRLAKLSRSLGVWPK